MTVTFSTSRSFDWAVAFVGKEITMTKAATTTVLMFFIAAPSGGASLRCTEQSSPSGAVCHAVGTLDGVA